MVGLAKNVLITGAAKRIGAACAKLLHAEGCNVALHYRASVNEVLLLADGLNRQRSQSAMTVQANLSVLSELSELVEKVDDAWGGIDVLVNNASSFYPTPMNTVSEFQWDEILGSNLKAPFFLTKMLADGLISRKGAVVNIVDIHAERGLEGYSVYSIAKAGLVGMTRILAKELAPEVRVNAIAPGAILWPNDDFKEEDKEDILQKIALRRTGSPDDIAKAVLFLIKDADYMTGQILTVDGGRMLYS